MSDWTNTGSSPPGPNLTPDKGIKKSGAPRVRIAQFGDGYSQRMADGINALNESWDLSFNNREYTDIVTIVNFLTAKGGVTAFSWAPPGGTDIKVICKDWSTETIYHTGNNATSYGSISMKFERVYE